MIGLSGVASVIWLEGVNDFSRNGNASLGMGVGGRWVIYSADPDQDTFNGLASGNTGMLRLRD